MTYYVTFKVDARYTAMVDADSLEEAKREAEYEFQEADLNEMECIDGEIVIVEDEKGDYLYEK